MAIKIDNMYLSNAVTGRRNQASKDSSPEIATEGKTDTYATMGDRVTLTKSVHSLVGLISSSSDVSEANIERIEQLKSTIRDGSYEINSEMIAKKLMRIEFGL